MSAAIMVGLVTITHAFANEWPGEKSNFKGYDQYDFVVEGVKCRVAVPKKVAEGSPWIWRARFWGHEPQVDIALLEKGYHVVNADIKGLFGAPKAVKRWDIFYNYLTTEKGFDQKAVLEGMSRGGLIAFNWAIQNPDKVHCMYLDAPVCDFKSWPGVNQGILNAYGFSSEDEGKAYKGNPIDNLEPLAKAGVPLLHVVGDKDEVVPVSENTAVVEARYKEFGGQIEVIHKPEVGHHPHCLDDPTKIVEFIVKHVR